LKILLAVFLGGGFGSLARFGIGKWAMSTFAHEIPVGTLIANILSCVILGIVVKLSQQEVFSGFWITFLVVGFCGGFSTFSTFSYETFELIRSGNYFFAAANLLVSIFLGIGVLFILARSMS